LEDEDEAEVVEEEEDMVSRVSTVIFCR